VTRTDKENQRSRLSAAAIVLWIATVAWAGVIFWLSSTPGSQLPGRFSEVGHLGEYFVLTTLLYWAARATGYDRYVAVAAVAFASFYGVTDEYHQSFVAMRTPDIADWGLDTIGAVAAVLVSLASVSLWRRMRARQPAQERQ
jgi:VanZ family protein